MRFKAVLLKDNIQVLKDKGKKPTCRIVFSPDSMGFDVHTSNDVIYSWCFLPKNWNECVCVSRRENLIAIEVDLDQLHQTAEKIDTSEQTVMHLTKRNNGSVLSFGFRRKLNDNMVDVFRDVAIRILQGDEADGVTAPSVRKPHWQLEVPRPKMFQAAIERCAHLGISEVGLNFILPDPANHDIGELKLKGSSGELDIEVNFIDCPRFAESEEDVSPDGIAQFQTKMLQQVVTTGCAISEKMVLCPSFGSTMVIYCVLHGTNDGTLQFFIPEYTD